MRLLIVQQTLSEGDYYRKKLEDQNFDSDVCTDGQDACRRLIKGAYDAALLDVRMPGLSGKEILVAIRQEKVQTPVIFLTEENELALKVECLNAGGSDYVVKPMDIEELAARIRAVTRTAAGAAAEILEVEDLALETRSHRVTRNGRSIDLTRREYALLEYLMMNRGRVLSKESILGRVWGYDFAGASNVVEVYVNYLRRKIDDGHDVKLIRTVRGRGYMMQEGRK